MRTPRRRRPRRVAARVGGLRIARALAVAGLVAAALGAAGSDAAGAVALPDGVRVETVVADANFPVAMAWAPDGRLFYTEKSGRIRIVEDGVLRDEPFASIEVDDFFERGLLGIAIDPNFSANGYVYTYFTHPEPVSHRLVRYRDEGGLGVEPVVLLDVVNPTGAGNHNGGNIHFGPDGLLYVTIGENAAPAFSQRLDTPLGKILRIRPADGSAPPDNPFYDDGDPQSGNDDRIWAWGLRNSFDFAFHPSTGEMFATENGPGCDDEINRISSGSNYGWRPGSPCSDPHSGFVPPLWRFSTPIALTGVTFANGATIPGVQGDMFVCAWNTSALMRFSATDASFRELTGFETWDAPCQTDVTVGPDGALYVSDQTTIRRIVAETTGTDDFAIPGGWFYTQAGGDLPGGFAIVDDAEATFWSDFNRLGGVAALGYPASRRFVLGGFLYQATQAALLQWHAATGTTRLANVLDMLAAAGHDPWLEAVRQIPPSRDWSGDEGLEWPAIVDQHLALLDGYPDLRARFTSVPDWVTRYGLPMGLLELDGVVVVRGQRAAFQQWKVAVPWAAKGEITTVLAGDLAKETELVPIDAQRPEQR